MKPFLFLALSFLAFSVLAEEEATPAPRLQVEAEAKRAAREADPPERKNLIIRHWRLDQPAGKKAVIK